MGMRMMFTVFLLVVLATSVVSFNSDRASHGRNAAAKVFKRIALIATRECCANPQCWSKNCR
uniref:A superfamily conotoxin Co1.3 n=1 Tax=Conus coronatus TaxID=89441 RepID=S4UJN8_CONCS|nr:A superfamily conotoxin Co1.3 precursor [Conus coronatus]